MAAVSDLVGTKSPHKFARGKTGENGQNYDKGLTSNQKLCGESHSF